MKKVFKSIIVATAISIFSITPKISVAQDDQSVTLQTFYDQLSPYGQWVDYPPYGSVFIPNAGPGFIPYSTNGHWEYTDQYGWTWASDYAWGWATFHYGRWNYDQSYGWFWVPDTEWGPAWVVWRNSDQYYGWAPLPSGVDINVGMNDGYGIPPNEWCFVSNQYMGDPNIGNYYMPRQNNDLFIVHSAVIFRMNYDNAHRYSFFAGPDRVEVDRYRHGRPIQPVVVNFSADRHHDNGPHELGMYHPAPSVLVRHDAPAPTRIVRVQDVPRRNVVIAPQRTIVPNRGDGGNHGGGSQIGNSRGSATQAGNRGNGNQGNSGGNQGGGNRGGNDHHR